MRKNDYSSNGSELALRVDERKPGQFHWVILSAAREQLGETHEALPEALHYRSYRAAAEPQPVYWNALLLGMAELRRVLGSTVRRVGLAGGGTTDSGVPGDNEPAQREFAESQVLSGV